MSVMMSVIMLLPRCMHADRGHHIATMDTYKQIQDHFCSYELEMIIA